MADLKELTSHIARSLVDAPDAVSVAEEQKGGLTVFKLSVAQPDIGKIIGRQGRTAAAFRAVLAALGERDQRRVTMDIVE